MEASRAGWDAVNSASCPRSTAAGLVIENARLRASQADAGEFVGTSRDMAEVRTQFKQYLNNP